MVPDAGYIPCLLTVSAPVWEGFAPFLGCSFLLLVLAFLASVAGQAVSLLREELRIGKREFPQKLEVFFQNELAEEALRLAYRCAVLLSTVLFAALILPVCAEWILAELHSWTEISYWVAAALSALVLTLPLSVLVVFMTKTVPMGIAGKNPYGIFRWMRPFIYPAVWLFGPFVRMEQKCRAGIARLVGADPEEKGISEEEIRLLVDEGNSTGTIETLQRDMIENIFEFDDTPVESIMTHRVDVVAVSEDASISDIVYLAINEGYSRIPVYRGNLDGLQGIIYVKDLLCLVGCANSGDFGIADFMRPAVFVPESKSCTELFREFTAKKLSMAVVVDEYGGTSGIVTMEDLLEEIVGNIRDEYDNESEDDVARLGDNTYELEGTVALEEIEKLLKIDFGERTDCDTIGGLLTDELGFIPETEDVPPISLCGYSFRILSVEEQRIQRVLARKE